MVEILLSGIFIGIEKMLFDGFMLLFLGLNYLFVFGYELVVCIVDVGLDFGWYLG